MAGDLMWALSMGALLCALSGYLFTLDTAYDGDGSRELLGMLSFIAGVCFIAVAKV